MKTLCLVCLAATVLLFTTVPALRKWSRGLSVCCWAFVSHYDSVARSISKDLLPYDLLILTEKGKESMKTLCLVCLAVSVLISTTTPALAADMRAGVSSSK